MLKIFIRSLLLFYYRPPPPPRQGQAGCGLPVGSRVEGAWHFRDEVVHFARPLPICHLVTVTGPAAAGGFPPCWSQARKHSGGGGLSFHLCEGTWPLMRQVLIRLSLFLWKTKKKDWLDLSTLFLKLKSTRISTMVEDFKFLVLELVQENVRFINSYSLRLILF